MKLGEFLNSFDFDCEIVDDEIKLIDQTGVNLGDIESERFPVDNLSSIVDRLDIYYQDYIFTGLEESLKEEYGIEINNWKEIYDHIKRLGLKWDMDVLPVIMGDEELTL